jgi:hypothetical protein
LQVATVLENGKLEDRFLPAVYFDTSVLIDYWVTESMELPLNEPYPLSGNEDLPHHKVMREILKRESWFKRLSKVIELRKKFLSSSPKLTPIVSPLALMELSKQMAEAGFRQILSDVAGARFAQRQREVGKLMKGALEVAKKETERHTIEGKQGIDPLNWLVGTTLMNLSFGAAHTLDGLWVADIRNFALTVQKTQEEVSAYPYLQVDIADVMHLLMAKHLGCKYIASFDDDFNRVKDYLVEDFNVEALISPDELMKILYRSVQS